MDVNKKVIDGCCGKKVIMLKLNRSVDLIIMNAIKKEGYKELEHFTKAGICYLYNNEIIITGSFGSNKLQIKAKSNSSEVLEKLISILENL